MPRESKAINLEINDIDALSSIANNPFSSKTVSNRAKIILLLAKGVQGKAIAEQLDIRQNTVTDVKKRFLESGIDGLFDHERPGRRGHDVPSPVESILTYVNNHKSDDLSIQAIGEALDIPYHTVRRVLHINGIQLQRTTVWDVETRDSIIGQYLQLNGIYISGNFMAVVIRSLGDSFSGSHPETGKVVTKDRLLAQRFKDGAGNKGVFSLADTLELASSSQHASSKAITFETFLRQIVTMSDECGIDFSEYHVILFQSGSPVSLSSNIMKHNVVVHLVDSIDAWRKYVENVLSVLEPIKGFSSPGKVLSALDYYLKHHAGSPFVWYLNQEKTMKNDGSAFEIGQNTPVQVAHVNQKIDIHDGESILCAFFGLFSCKDGKITQNIMNYSTPVPHPEDDSHFSSAEAYTEMVTAYDDAITKMKDSMGQSLMEACLNGKKKLTQKEP